MADPATRATLDVIRRFNEAFNRHDVDGVMALMTADCVFENTLPAPDGERFEGAGPVRGSRRRRSSPPATSVWTCCASATARLPRSSPT